METGAQVNQKVSAIAWAAQIVGETYGKYFAALSEEQKESIYQKYAQLVEESRQAERMGVDAAASSAMTPALNRTERRSPANGQIHKR